MSTNKKPLALALAAAAVLATSVEVAKADAYARSYLNITNGVIAALDGPQDPADATVISYLAQVGNNTQNDFVDNGNNVSGGCVIFPPALNTCGNGTPVINLTQADSNSPVGEDDYGFNPGSGTYTRADSVQDSFAIVDVINGDSPATTATQHIAESRVAQQTIGRFANSFVNSTTGLDLNFDDAGEKSLFIGFNADWDQMAETTGGSNLVGSATSNLVVSLTLRNLDNGNEIQWKPGEDFTACDTLSYTCVENSAGDLNSEVAITSFPGSGDNIGSGFFSLLIQGLESAEYSLVLNADVSTLVSQIPAPATLGLMGLGLAGLGLRARKKK